MSRYAVIMLVLMSVPQLLFAATVGTLARTDGEVLVKGSSSHAYIPVKQGQAIHEGNWIKTGKKGWAELSLSDGSTFTIANNTELEVNSFLVGGGTKNGSFTLAQGKLRASVVKLGGQQTDIKVKSRTAVAGIRGTEFLMLAEGPANVFFGNEGVVSVSGSRQESSKALVAGTMTQNTRGDAPLEPVAVEPGTPLAQAKKSFDAVTAAIPPASWLEADNLASIIARWNINYGRYLADSGSYDAALHVFQIALDLTPAGDIRADARMERGAVYSRLLSNARAALAEYQQVLEEYPSLKQAEAALVFAGQALYDLGQNNEAMLRFTEYLKKYPTGKYRGTVETMLNQLRNDR